MRERLLEVAFFDEDGVNGLRGLDLVLEAGRRVQVLQERELVEHFDLIRARHAG